MKRIGALLCVLMLFCIPLCGCRSSGRDSLFRLPIDTEPAQLDPQMAVDSVSKEVLAVLFEGLTRIGEDGVVYPAAADYTVSEDGLCYTFTLRESYWSTQAKTDWETPVPVTAQDFAFAIERLRDPATGSPWASLAADLTAQAVDDIHLIIRLTAPDDDLPRRLAACAFYPCHRAFFESAGGRYGLEKNTLLCNGAFYLQAWNHQNSLLCNRNAGYHAAADIAPSAVRFVVTADAADALVQGSVDIAPVPETLLSSLDGYTVTRAEDTVTALWFAADDAIVGDAQVRTALRDAVEWSTVSAQVQTNGHTPAAGYLPGDCVLSGDIPYRTRTNALPFVTRDSAVTDWQAAVARLEPAGAPRLEVLCADNDGQKLLAQQLIQSWQRNLGIYCTVTAVSEQQLAARVASGRYQIALCDTVCADRTAVGAFAAYTTGGGNPGGYASAAFDALWAAAADRDSVEALETLLWQDCPCVPLAFVTRCTAVAPAVEGLSMRPFGGGQTGQLYTVTGALRFD